MTLLLLSTADTDLLAARAAADPAVPLRLGNPARVEHVDLGGVAVVVVRLLGGRRAWDGFDALLGECRQRGIPVVAVGGEAALDAELTAASTVPAGVVADAAAYLREGGVDNLRELVAFLSDTVLMTGHGFAPPTSLPAYGVRGSRPRVDRCPTVGVVYYRAHQLSGNAAFVDVLCDELERQGANALPVYVGSLRPDADGRIPVVADLLGGVDALVVTVLASGGSNAADAEGWDATALAALDVPVLQALCVTSSRADWAASDAGLAPIDAAMQVAIPEFDGRLITAPFSFKEVGEDGVPTYVADPERAARVAGIAVAHARLRSVPNADKRLAIVLSNYPTKHSRVGNAVGLDTPASAVLLLQALRDAGYDVGAPGGAGKDSTFPEDGDELVHTLIAAGGHDVEWLTEEQLEVAAARVPLADYTRWFDALPASLRDGMLEHWGPPPGSLYVDGDDIVLAALQYGNVVLMIQPPRGFLLSAARDHIAGPALVEAGTASPRTPSPTTPPRPGRPARDLRPHHRGAAARAEDATIGVDDPRALLEWLPRAGRDRVGAARGGPGRLGRGRAAGPRRGPRALRAPADRRAPAGRRRAGQSFTFDPDTAGSVVVVPAAVLRRAGGRTT